MPSSRSVRTSLQMHPSSFSAPSPSTLLSNYYGGNCLINIGTEGVFFKYSWVRISLFPLQKNRRSDSFPSALESCHQWAKDGAAVQSFALHNAAHDDCRVYFCGIRGVPQNPYFSFLRLKAASPPSMMRLIASRTSSTSMAPFPTIVPRDWSPAVL